MKNKNRTEFPARYRVVANGSNWEVVRPAEFEKLNKKKTISPVHIDSIDVEDWHDKLYKQMLPLQKRVNSVVAFLLQVLCLR